MLEFIAWAGAEGIRHVRYEAYEARAELAGIMEQYKAHDLPSLKPERSRNTWPVSQVARGVRLFKE